MIDYNINIGDKIKGILIETLYKQKNSINGCAKYHGDEVFYKIMENSRASLEEKGYKVLEPFFPQPKFIKYSRLDPQTGLVVFERVPELEIFENLMAGWIRSGIKKEDVKNSKEWNTICNLIQSTNERTLNIGPPSGPVEYHSRDKVKKEGKLDKIYGSRWEGLDFLYSIYKVKIDGKHVPFDWSKYKSELREFGTTKETTIKSISHGCLSELNLSMLPMFFDVTSAGNNPVMASIVCFYLSISFTDDYIVPKFIPDLVPRFPQIINQLKRNYGHDWNMEKNIVEVEFKEDFNPIRETILEDWYSKIVDPLIERGTKLKPDWDWKNEFVQYSILRTLALFNLGKIDKSDQALIISYIARLHDWKKKPKEYNTYPRIGKMN